MKNIYQPILKMENISIQDFIVNPVLSVSWKAGLVYAIKKLYILRKGLFVFLSSVISVRDLISEIGPSMFGTLVYRCFRYTLFGKRHVNFSTIMAALAFFYTSRWSTCKLLASYIASCWIFQILKNWDRINASKKLDRKNETTASTARYKPSPWVRAAHVCFTGLSCGWIYYKMPKLAPKWFRKGVKIAGGHSGLKKGRLERYVNDYMQHCSGHHHVFESCTLATLHTIPSTYIKCFILAANLEIPSLVLKRNLKKSLWVSHQISVFATCQLFLVHALVCSGNAIIVKKGTFKLVYRYFHTLIIGWVATYITSRYIIRNVYWDEFFGVSYGQVTLHCIMEMCGPRSFFVVGILALNSLRKRTERPEESKQRSKTTAVANFLVSLCIGHPIVEKESKPEAGRPPAGGIGNGSTQPQGTPGVMSSTNCK